MHISYLDQYLPGRSWVHQLDARVKFLAVAAFVLACALTPAGAWGGFAMLGGIWGLTVALAGIRYSVLLRRGLVALPFALAAVTLLFTRPGDTLVMLPVGRWTVRITAEGVTAFLSVMLKSWLSVLMALLLTATTSYPDLLRALSGIGLPRVLVAIIGFMYRYLFVLADEAQRLLRAREARSARPAGRRGGGSIAWRARVAGGMVGNLFMRSYERSERIYQAMVSRGYAGEIRTLSSPRLSWRDVASLGVFLGLLLAVQIATRWVR
ncbi:MAG: cobalt ECF transporter T component CbiQ [Anaerolineae bacterium]